MYHHSDVNIVEEIRIIINMLKEIKANIIPILKIIKTNILNYLVMILIVFALLLVFVIVIIKIVREIMTVIEEKQRPAKIKKFAALNGFEFDEKAELFQKIHFLLPSEISLTPQISKEKAFAISEFKGYSKLLFISMGPNIFSWTYKQVVKNLILVPYNNTKLIFADYYTKSAHDFTTRQTIALLKSLNKFPEFSLVPKIFLHKIANSTEYKTITFEGFEKFSETYQLSYEPEDEIEVLNFFTPERIRVFEENPGWNIYTGNNYFVAYKEKTLGYVKVEDYLTYIEEVKNLFSLLKLE